MMYLLDTNVISAVRRPDHSPQVAAWLRSKPEQDLFISAITLAEIERGIRQEDGRDPVFVADLRNWLDRIVLIFPDRLLPFGADDARIWGRLSAQIGHNGTNLMIAASALRHNAVAVTGNVSDFAPTGVTFENPFVQ